MATYFATPYNYSFEGFEFDSLEEYEEKFEQNLDRAEEYEIQLVDSDDELLAVLFEKTNGGSKISKWLEFAEEFELLNELEQVALFVIFDEDRYTDYETALDQRHDIDVYEGDLKEYAHELVSDLGIESIANSGFYFDYESFGRDVRLEAYDDEDIEMYENMSDEEIGEYIVNDVYGGIESVDEDIVERYFDYDYFARDLSYDYSEIMLPSGIVYTYRMD